MTTKPSLAPKGPTRWHVVRTLEFIDRCMAEQAEREGISVEEVEKRMLAKARRRQEEEQNKKASQE